MCSKKSPAGSETCRYCGARLIPLGSTPAPTPSSPAPSDPADWLKDLRLPGAEEPVQETGGEEIPDWLADVRGSAATPAGDDLPDWMKESAASPSTPAGDDWLSSLREPAEPAADAPAGPVSDTPADGEDWIANLQAWAPAETPAQPDQPAESPAAPPAWGEQDDLSSWLKGLDAESEPAAPAAEQPAQPAGEVDWASQFSQAAAPAEDPAAPPAWGEQDDLSSWLKGLDAESEPAAPGAEQPAQPAGEVDWASQFSQVTPAEEPQAERSLEEWLSEGLDSAAPPAAAQPPAAPTGEGLPDWLTGFSAVESGQPAAPAQANDDFSAWLSQAAEEPAAPPAQAPAEPALPDWLAEMKEAGAPAQPPAGQEALPAWMSDESAEPTAAQPAVEPDFEAMFAEPGAPEVVEQPWMENVKPQAPVAPSQPAEKLPPAFDAPPAIPDWLAAFAETPGEAGQAKTPFIDPQQPEWLKGIDAALPPAAPLAAPALIEEQPQAQPELEQNAPFQVDLPDWLDHAEAGESAGPAEGEEEENLAQAELPSWVQEMRPLESVIPGQAVIASADQQRIEKAGPLAGMRGVLPAEETAAHFRKLPAYSARLRVSERQHLHAGLLQNVLDLESQAAQTPGEASQAPQYLYRLLIAAVLAVAVVFGLLFGDASWFAAPAPSSSDRGLVGLYNEIESVQGGAPVLVAVDYEAALSGEMRFAASAVLEHLMARGMRLVVVSTVPAGPCLANDLLTGVQRGVPGYDLAVSSINLGYLPGGATSLLEFAQRPAGAAPLDQNGVPAWDQPVLQGVQTIQDFKMVLVLTDSAETGRAWVEQVQPVLGSAPLVMVASAQAGPLLLPYLDAGQVKGLVSGLMGGATYEQLIRKPNIANKDWGAYQMGMLAGILMLVLGGAFSALRRPRRKPGKATV